MTEKFSRKRDTKTEIQIKMRLTNLIYSKDKTEKAVGVFEVCLMILSVLSISYMIGQEIELVSAVNPIRYSGRFVPGKGYVPFGSGSGSVGAGAGAGAATVPPVPAATPIPAAPPVPPTAPASSVIGPTGPVSGPPGYVDPTTAVGLNPDEVAAIKAARLKAIGTQLLQTALTAAVLYFGVKWIAGLLGASEENAKGLGLAAALGFAGAQALAILGTFGTGWLATPIASLSWGPFMVTPAGLIAAAVVALLWAIFGWTDYRAYLVTFTCLPWQPASGGQYCEQCNEPLFGTEEVRCSKYRCESLGLACRMANEGTEDEMCYWADKNDVTAPDIKVNEEVLSGGFSYTPEAPTSTTIGGAIIKYNANDDGCIPAYQRFDFGIELNKLGACKADTNITATYGEMANPLSYARTQYNHTITMSLEGSINDEGDLEFPNADIQIYIKCESANGYANDRPFVFKYSVCDEPDTSAPQIKGSDPVNNWPIKQGETSKNVKIYVDKPSECKWSYNNEGFDAMQNPMSSNGIGKYGYYEFTTTLTGLKDSMENKFYFKCKSYPGADEANRYAMAEPYVYTLIGTKGLIIDSVTPKDTTIRDSVPEVKVTITARTSQGYKNGESNCRIRESSAIASSPFFSDVTPTYLHTQDLYLSQGSYSYEIDCCDLGLNCDNETISFNVETDIAPPMVVRAYREGGSLKLITNEESQCVYDTTSCNYAFDNGVAISNSNNKEHTAEWNTENTYYVKCRDEYGGEPAGDQCTIVVRPSDTF